MSTSDQPADKRAEARDAFIQRHWGGFAGPTDCARAVDELIAAALADTERAKDEKIAELREALHLIYTREKTLVDIEREKAAGEHTAGFREGIEAASKVIATRAQKLREPDKDKGYTTDRWAAGELDEAETEIRSLQPPENQPSDQQIQQALQQAKEANKRLRALRAAQDWIASGKLRRHP